MKKINICYLQSGGPTAVINSSLLGVVLESFKHEEVGNVFGSIYGVEGLMKDNLIDLRNQDIKELTLLRQTPGAALGSTRHKLTGLKDDDFDKICETIRKHEIDYVFVNGGNDSMDTCAKLAKTFEENDIPCKTIGIPKTVDNDLIETDFCPGFPSSAKHILNTVKMMSIDGRAYSKGKAIIMEAMGRSAGWLTSCAYLLDDKCRPDLIYLPESKFDINEFLKSAEKIWDEKNSLVVLISEGIDVPHLNHGGVDGFGHPSLEGAAEYLAKEMKDQLNIPNRVMVMSVPQRADPTFLSKVDQEIAEGVGAEAVRAAIAGKNGVMIAIKRTCDRPYKYKLEPVDASMVANKEKKLPLEWFDENKMPKQEFYDYVEPLLCGETEVKYENGVFASAKLDFTRVK